MTPLVLLLLLPLLTQGLNNGLARLPPMGWMSWQRFRCNIDCEAEPLECINENLFRTQGEEMVLKGFLDVGYEYVIIDDCWMEMERDEDGRLQADAERFPSGIPDLSDYIRSLGLKFGIYEDYGNYTCAGYPGILGHLETDANTFAEWGTDYIKIDGCYISLEEMVDGYPEFGAFLNATGRPIVYSCSWPAYWEFNNQDPDYAAIAAACNLWRNWDDIQDSWESVLSIINWFGDEQDRHQQHAGPGNWNDPDMLIIGNFGLSYDQSRTQMAIWAVLAAPLIMSNDLRTIRPEFVEILTNRNVIAIDQDPMGIQGRRIVHDTNSDVDIWVRPIQPSLSETEHSAAVAVMYTGYFGTPVDVSFTPEEVGLDHAGGYAVEEVFDGRPLGIFMPGDTITVDVNPTGVQLLRFDIIPVAHSPGRKIKNRKGHYKYEGEKIFSKKGHSLKVSEAGLKGCGEDKEGHY